MACDRQQIEHAQRSIMRSIIISRMRVHNSKADGRYYVHDDHLPVLIQGVGKAHAKSNSSYFVNAIASKLLHIL